MAITPTQSRILDLVRTHLAQHGYPPSLRELASAADITFAAVRKHLQKLEQEGLIELPRHTARGIRLTGDTRTDAHNGLLALPLVGKVAAGAPMLVEAHIERRVAVDPSLFHPRPDYLLRVEGESMIDAGIESGDLIAVHRTPEAHNGQIVVARLDGAVTVKVFHRDSHGIRLLPRNSAYAPILPNEHLEFAIEGLYCGLVRSAP
ncbi:MAG TPA: transcriptional repressor LexA [Nevskiaceae bacterium]|nr:transcriptional repressor LexA [Nevskiaceae bacterium]